jgi:hypothetical protein
MGAAIENTIIARKNIHPTVAIALCIGASPTSRDCP